MGAPLGAGAPSGSREALPALLLPGTGGGAGEVLWFVGSFYEVVWLPLALEVSSVWFAWVGLTKDFGLRSAACWSVICSHGRRCCQLHQGFL